MKKHNGISKLLVLIGTAALSVIGITTTMHIIHAHSFPPALRGLAVAPKSIGQVQLVDKNGKPLDNSYFKGKWTMVFFGYTNCPDVCPSTLMQLRELYKSIQKHPGSGDYQFLFITVDPARDKLPRLKSYVEYFNKNFDAAAGNMTYVKSFEKVFGAFHHYLKKSKNDMHYSVAHSAEVYIVSPNERYVAKFLPPINISKLTIKLSQLNAFVQKHGSNA